MMSMAKHLLRKLHTGEPGNQGQFGSHRRDDASVSLETVKRREPDRELLDAVMDGITPDR